MSEWWNVPCRLILDRYLVFASPGGEDLVADVLRPDGDETLPGMVVVAGGGWRQCNKRNLEQISIVLASWGYVTMNLSYRVAPSDPWPACMQDCKTAVRWLRAHAEDYGLNPTAIGALGNSAGGHLAAMLAVTPGAEHFGGTEHTDEPGDVQAAVCMAATTDMTAQYEFFEKTAADKPGRLAVTVDLLGGTPQQVPQAYWDASPISHVSAGSAPIYFIHGADDPIVPIEPVRLISGRLKDCGVDSPLEIIGGFGHGVMKECFYSREAISPAPRVREFLARHLSR